MTSRRPALLLSFLILGCDPEGDDGGSAGGKVDDPRPSSTGGACSCDAECPAIGSHEGICVLGVCMTRASGACSAAGSRAECASGSRCWELQGHEGSICWPDCDAYTCGGTCDGDGSCGPAAMSDCDAGCGSYCSAPPPDLGIGPGAGPGPECASLPPLTCTRDATACAELIPWNPHTGPGYDDYPINGETPSNQYRSYLRRDTQMLIAYATAKVACKSAGWAFGNVGVPLGLGDMSEANGAIPGTSIGSPGHPAGTHVNGHDIDLAYYQVGTPDNTLRPICEHVDGGQDQYHCVAPPDLLDLWRSALFLGFVFEHPNVRVVGADGKAGPLLEAAIRQLCADGWLASDACSHVSLAYEETDMGYGWYQFHHHHMHVSFGSTRAKPGGEEPRGPMRVMECLSPDCAPSPPALKRR